MHGSQIRPQLSVGSTTKRPQSMVMITIVLIKLKLWPAIGCEAKVGAEISPCPFLYNWPFFLTFLALSKQFLTLCDIF